jgi:dephospho-CoA kinase
MIRWAVTGPAGGGKSTLCGMLAERGAAVVDGDLLGHTVLARPDVIDEIRRQFGHGIVDDGKVDRGALGQIVFSDPRKLERLNRITLAPIGELAAVRLESLANEGRYRLAVLEAAVYFLFPPVAGVDMVITVTADPEIRIARMMAKGSLTRAQALARVAAQLPLENAWAKADLVVDNGGSPADLASIADRLWSRVGDGP